MAAAPQDPKSYHRIKLAVSALGLAAMVAYATAWVRWGAATWVDWTSNRWVGLLGFAVVFALAFEILTIPLDYYGGFVVEHRYQLSRQKLARWCTQTLKGWLVGGFLGGVLVSGLYGALWYGGWWWWLWVWMAAILLAVTFAYLFPVTVLPLFYKSEVLQDENITRRLHALARRSSINLAGVFRLELSQDTAAANAMLTGLGATRRVYLADTLLDAFSPEEIDIVFAHELGHHNRHHMWKSLALSAVVGTLYVALVAWILHPFRGGQPEMWPQAVIRLPLVILGITLLSGILQPLTNAVSRRFERQCDRDALIATGDPEAYRRAYSRLAAMNLADPDPHPLVEWYFYDHPAMKRRIALADQL